MSTVDTSMEVETVDTSMEVKSVSTATLVENPSNPPKLVTPLNTDSERLGQAVMDPLTAQLEKDGGAEEKKKVSSVPLLVHENEFEMDLVLHMREKVIQTLRDSHDSKIEKVDSFVINHFPLSVTYFKDRLILMDVRRYQAGVIMANGWKTAANTGKCTADGMALKDRVAATLVSIGEMFGDIAERVLVGGCLYNSKIELEEGKVMDVICYTESNSFRMKWVPGTIPFLNWNCASCGRFARSFCPGGIGRGDSRFDALACTSRFCTPMCANYSTHLHAVSCRLFRANPRQALIRALAQKKNKKDKKLNKKISTPKNTVNTVLA